MPFKRIVVHVVTLILALLTFSLLYNFIQQVIQSANLETQRAELEADVAQLEAENEYLRGAVAYAESSANVERLARDRLNYAREGDIVVIPQFADPLPTAPMEPSPGADLEAIQTSTGPPPVPNWQRWWQAFVSDHQRPVLGEEE